MLGRVNLRRTRVHGDVRKKRRFTPGGAIVSTVFCIPQKRPGGGDDTDDMMSNESGDESGTPVIDLETRRGTLMLEFSSHDEMHAWWEVFHGTQALARRLARMQRQSLPPAPGEAASGAEVERKIDLSKRKFEPALWNKVHAQS